jgi:hypothetical protein
MSRLIAWESFDPNELDDDIETNSSNSQEIQYIEHDEASGGFNNELFVNFKIRTPFGYYEPSYEFSPYRRFELWVANCNFQITDQILEDISACEGISAVKCLSRYSFIIGIERTFFSFSGVRRMLNEILNLSELENSDAIDYEESEEILISGRWAAFIHPDGRTERITLEDFETEDEFDQYIQILKGTKGGNIITSEPT